MSHYDHTVTKRSFPAEPLQHNKSWSMGTASASTLTMEIGIDVNDVIHAAQAGDESAFASLIDYYQATAQRLARQILRTEEAAADAVQDALIKIHRALPRFQDGNFKSWLLRIVTNTCYDHLRSQKRRRSLSLDELIEDSGFDVPYAEPSAMLNPERIVGQRESMQVLLDTISQLPTWHRNVVLLVDVYGYDYNEAAETLQLPIGTVKSRLSRARAVLRDRLIEADLVPDHFKRQ